MKKASNGRLTGPLFLTHSTTHVDEFAADLLMRKYAGPVIPGIQNAPMLYIGADTETYEGLNGDKLLERDIVALGVCGGPFDEHPRNGKPPKDSCAAGLAFAWLQEQDLIPVEEVAAWVRIINRINRNDQKGEAAPCDIFRICSAMHDVYGPGKEEKVRHEIQKLLELLFRADLQLFTVAKEAFEKNVTWHTVMLDGGEEAKVAHVISDCLKVLQYAGDQFGHSPTLLLQTQPGTKHVLLKSFTVAIPVEECVVKLREAELRVRGFKEPHSRSELAAPNQCAYTPWYYFVEANQVMAGSKSSPEAPGSMLSQEEQVECVLAGLQKTKPDFQKVTERLSHNKPNNERPQHHSDSTKGRANQSNRQLQRAR